MGGGVVTFRGGGDQVGRFVRQGRWQGVGGGNLYESIFLKRSERVDNYGRSNEVRDTKSKATSNKKASGPVFLLILSQEYFEIIQMLWTDMKINPRTPALLSSILPTPLLNFKIIFSTVMMTTASHTWQSGVAFHITILLWKYRNSPTPALAEYWYWIGKMESSSGKCSSTIL